MANEYYPVNILLQKKNGLPAIEIRKLTGNTIAIKTIIDAAFSNKPLIVQPIFKDKLRAISALSKAKILTYDYEKGVYKYLI